MSTPWERWGPPPPPPVLPPPISPAPRRERWWLHGLLLALTFGTMTFVGTLYLGGLGIERVRHVTTVEALTLSALFYALPLALILLSHEMGHYLMCRRYGIDASPPYFLPFPSLFGTMGAFIRIREPMRRKRELFDIGVAGPLAGFVVTIPFLLYGLLHTRPSPEAGMQEGSFLFSYPPIVTLLQDALLPFPFDSTMVFEHPTFMAAWAGLFVTMFNLIPLGQLDGGHALYAVAGRRIRWFTFPLLAGLVALGFRFMTWWILAALVLVFGVSHPRVDDEDAPLGAPRAAVAALTLAVFLLCFLPVPFVTSSAPRRPPDEGRGTFVHKLDRHHGAEEARRRREAVRPQRRDVPLEERRGEVRFRGPLEAGAPPA